MSKPWFGPKEYGYGLSPKTTAGWVVTAVFAVVLVAGSIVLKRAGVAPGIAVAAMLGLIAAFVAFAVYKSDRSAWKWRWGRGDEPRP